MRIQSVKHFFRKDFNGWWLVSLIGAAIILLPILFIFFSIFQEPNENWYQIKEYLLKNYAANSIILVLLTGLFTAVLGVSLAWIVAAYDFPMRRFFSWGLLLPLAIPPYIAAYTYRTMLSYTGVVQVTLRNQFDYQIDPEWLAISSLRGAVFIFTIFLFPYVYIMCRAFLENQSASFLENARLLGRKPFSIFVRIVLPLSRPAMVAGAVLVVYEVLSDYGVTSYFGIHTITTAIFQTWFGMYDADSAMRLAAWLMVIVVGLFFIEKWLRQGRRYSIGSKARPLARQRLRGLPAAAAFAYCLLIFLLGFLIPVIQLLAWSKLTFAKVWDDSFFTLLNQTVYVALIATVLILLFAVILANVTRTQSSGTYILSKLATAGYSIPGAIIAIGILALFIELDSLLAPFYSYMGWGNAPLILSLSLSMLVIGYTIRFMATGYNAVEVGFEKIGPKYTEASRMLGFGVTKTFFKVDLPLIKGALFSGFILTFVEIIKELPLALLLRPFNFDTLATKTYQYAKDEMIHEAAIPSLMIILLSVVSVAVFQMIDRKVKK
ncbi:iron ABC transporter [[Bacillus] enclensis]|uniref:Iron(III) transport system permease protein n=1 Tax=[Bacillus] enclensis TaxID=1402860 RepID=A0A0V8HBS9_9BACI|nr:iron ABC transporter permease [[Bacillus] enclensis]KSU59954.1 iron ABC transporter [[Bacillus] enclensis]SCC29125.1 iron(III) transport system permease protein [[Bacillus] enclensis]